MDDGLWDPKTNPVQGLTTSPHCLYYLSHLPTIKKSGVIITPPFREFEVKLLNLFLLRREIYYDRRCNTYRGVSTYNNTNQQGQ